MRRLALLAVMTVAATIAPVWEGTSAAAGFSAIHHVFVIVLENESASTTFGPNSPAPYLSHTLRSQGAYLPYYHAIGHQSNDNYIAMISGQAPNPDNQADCLGYQNFEPDVIGAYGQAVGQGCIFPSDVKTVADQLDARGLTWRDYNDSMGADPSREASECGHPGVDSQDNTQSATAADQYATRHNPFVYFHSIVDDTTLCDTHVVNLDLLPQDLASIADTPNYVFITPSLCNDGHDTPCANGQPGGLTQADTFLHQWVPRITGSPAFRYDNGLLMILFDEAATSDASSCCGEVAGPNSPSPGGTGPGGGDTGAVLLSPCITPGTVSTQPYNHYTMLRSVEDMFGLGHLGYAQLPGQRSFGGDVFNHSCQGLVRVRAPAVASRTSTTPKVTVHWRAVGGIPVRSFTVQVRRLGPRRTRWRTLLKSTKRHSLSFKGKLGRTYQFRVRAKEKSGVKSSWSTATTVMPTGVRPPGGHYRGAWHVVGRRGAWEGQAIAATKKGSSFRLSYRGAGVAIVGERGPRAGVIEVTIDGVAHTVVLHARRAHDRQVVFRVTLPFGRHRLQIRLVRKSIALEGFAISARRP